MKVKLAAAVATAGILLATLTPAANAGWMRWNSVKPKPKHSLVHHAKAHAAGRRWS